MIPQNVPKGKVRIIAPDCSATDVGADGILDFAPSWPKETIKARLENCRKMLFIHGILSDSDNLKLQKKISKFN